MKVESPFTEARVKMWTRIYYALYRRGVADAHDCIDNEGAIREYLDQTWAQNTWGTLKTGITDRQYRWQYYLLELAESLNVAGVLRDFLTVMGTYPHNYFSCAFVVSMDFYRKGVQDYINNHMLCDYERYMAYKKDKAYFTAKGVKRISVEKLIDDARMMADFREELDAKLNTRFSISAGKYLAFRRRLAQGTWRTKMSTSKVTIRYR